MSIVKDSIWHHKPEPAKCICKQEQEALIVHHCEVCKCDTDDCFQCMPEPECTCTYTDVDMCDALGCELHDRDSYYNHLARKARRMPPTREEVLAEIYAAVKKMSGRSA